jgi:hypothetical protein
MASGVSTGTFAAKFEAGNVITVWVRGSLTEFDPGIARLSICGWAGVALAAGFSTGTIGGGLSADLLATRFALSEPRLKKLTTPKTEMTDAKSITPFGRNSCRVKSVAHRSQNRRLVHNFHSVRSIFSPQLQQKLGRKSIVTHQKGSDQKVKAE